MNKVYELMIDIAASIAILFIAVMIFFGLKTELIIKSLDKESINEFLSDAKKNGYITTNDYENFLEKLSMTGVLYDITFEHQYKVFEPEYRMRTLEEIIAAQKAAYPGTNVYHYREIETQKPIVTDPIDNSGLTMNTQTNENILATATATPSMGHVHTDECYDGHVHKGSAGPFMIPHAHDSTCISGYTCAIGYAMHCNNCGKDYPGWYSWYYREPSGALTSTGSDLYGYKYCPYCSSNRTSQGAEVHNFAHICGYDRDDNADGYLDAPPKGVTYDYPSQYPPASVGKATYNNGCYVYHVHKTTQMEYNNAASISSVPQTLTYHKLFQNGLINYCDVPKYFSIGIDSLNYKYPGFAVLYRTEYNASSNSFTFYFEAYQKSQYGSYIYSNPGFPAVLSEAQLYSTYRDKYAFVSLWNRIGTIGSLSTDYCDFCVNYSSTDLIDLCDFTMFNQWYLGCGKEGNGTLACNLKVISITPTNPIQAVYTGERLITTARATYMDGSTGVVLCTTGFIASSPVKNADVIISYTDAKGTLLTAHMTVTVVPKNKTCPYGHIYNLKPDGSDPGCPYCTAWVDSIRVQYPTTSTMTITIGTTMQDNGVKLLVRYLDGRTETITSGYVDNLDNTYHGTKLVTIGYKGATTSLMVTTICKKMTCAICGFVYDLYPDGTNPGCPKCISKTPVFTGNILKYNSTDYTDLILEDLYEDGIYQLNPSDKFTVRLQNRSSTITNNLLKRIYSSLPKRWLSIEKSTRIKRY